MPGARWKKADKNTKSRLVQRLFNKGKWKMGKTKARCGFASCFCSDVQLVAQVVQGVPVNECSVFLNLTPRLGRCPAGLTPAKALHERAGRIIPAAGLPDEG